MNYNKEEIRNIISIFGATFEPRKGKLKDDALGIYVRYYGIDEIAGTDIKFFNDYKNKEVTIFRDFPTEYYFVLEENNICLPSLCIDWID